MITPTSSNFQPIVVVTGGSGFLGKAIVHELLDANSPIIPKEIRVFDIKPYTGKQSEIVKIYEGDIRNYEEVNEACKGSDIVIHSAAIIDWGTRPKSEVLNVNVGGTENILKACLENNIHNLLYTSSLDAVYTGTSLVNIDESQEYPEKHQTSYCESKYLGEK